MNELFRAIPNLLDEFGDNPELREALVFAAWKRIAGESLNQHTVPFRLFGKHLVIAVADLMWKRHLELLSQQMIYKLNAAMNQELVTFIEFRIDEDTVKTERSKIAPKEISEEEFRELALENITPALRHSADSIKDDNMRYLFLLAAGSCLARKKKLESEAQ